MDPKENPVDEKPKEDSITVKPKHSPISEYPQELYDPQLTFASQKNSFSLLVMVYDKVDDRDQLSYENLALGRPRFYGTIHLKIEAKVFLP